MHETIGFYTVKDICRILNVCRTTLWRMRRDGVFPDPPEIYGRLLRWPKHQVDEWVLHHWPGPRR
ncbi:helix-turn-helix transcriptional regulator [Sinorhizobium meliloti]|uniref:helix-turn-helix transcriptional regulator n=1 Tax=Rhizobium meliloti TaxID=382 RepID=UPI003F1611C4